MPLICVFALSLFNLPAYALTQATQGGNTLLSFINNEKSHLTTVIEETKQASMPKNGVEYTEQMHKLSTLLTITKAKFESLQALQENINRSRVELNQKLKHVQQLPLASTELDIQQRVTKIQNLLIENRQTAELIDDNMDLNKTFQNTLKIEIDKLALWNSKYQLEQKLVTISQQKIKLNEQLSQLFVLESAKKSVNKTKAPSAIDQEAKTMINNQHIALIHHQLNALDLQKDIIKAKIMILQNANAKTLQIMVDVYEDVLSQNTKLMNSLQQMLANTQTEVSLVVHRDLKKSVVQLKESINQQVKQLTVEQKILNTELHEHQNQLKKLVSVRQSLSDYSFKSWPLILNKLSAIPGLFYKYSKTLATKVYDSYAWLNVVSLSILWSLLAFLAVGFFLINRYLKSLILYKERSRLSGYLFDGFLTIIQRNVPYFCLFSMVWTLMYWTNISYSNYQLMLRLCLVWFTFRIFILIARIGLLERISDSTGKDVKLYYRLKWLLLFGGWTSALMTFSHLLPLSLLIQDIFNRLFMLFILTMSLVILRSQDVINHLLHPLLIAKKRYIKHAISLLVLLIPITLFSTAIIGLSGYINLAWSMSRYQAYALVVLVGYVLARGLLFDALEYISESMVGRLNNGWLWIEVFLKPADKLLRILLLTISLAVLFQLYGWFTDLRVLNAINRLVGYSLINLNGIHITVASTIEFIIAASILVWASMWIREFCYRWLYKSTKDTATRNSLSIFTQYAVILIGSFTTLRILGLDFSGLSMILGGLAVGMGFGLRDFASNIVGGIMLLIERPVREGDIVSIGEHEGKVSHVGIRCMRISSWDKTEILIPNAETFNKPFTNWTHQDSIVRTVLPIKVARSDDPVMVQQLILDVLAIIPEIVDEPPSQVVMKKIDEALIEFEVRYFINVLEYSRVKVRSALLFAITAQFKAAGIKPPVEPIAVEFKEGQSELLPKKESAEN